MRAISPVQPRLRQLTPEDAPRGALLSQTVGWAQTPADWERAIRWAGEGAFCLDDGDQLLASALAIVYSPALAWIGMVITHADYQRQGYSTRLMRRVFDYLHQQGIQSIMLDASGDGLPVYERLGFRAVFPIEIWSAEASAAYPAPPVSPLAEADLPAVANLDAEIFGVARPQVIHDLYHEFPNYAWVDKQDGQVTGYLMAQLKSTRQFAHLGPWMHRTPEGAERLLHAALNTFQGRPLRADIPGVNEAATALARQHGFTNRSQTTRMIYGDAPPPPAITDHYYGIAAFTVG